MQVDPSIQELYDKRNTIKSAALNLLKDTIWPSDSKKAADALRQAINDLPDFHTSVKLTASKDTIAEFVRVLESAYTRIEAASQKYGKAKRGVFGAVKAKLSSGHRGRCTNTLWDCQADIMSASAELRNCLSKISTSDPVQSSATAFELQTQSNTPLVEVNHPPESSEAPQPPQMKPAEQTVASEHPTNQPTSPENPSAARVDNRKEGSPLRDKVLMAARITFKTVEAGSQAIPVVGGFVGVAAKVGSAFVDMIETMGENEAVSQELASHTSKLSSCIEYFNKRVDSKNGDEVAGHIEDLRKELECVQEKVKTWKSTSSFKKLLLSSGHAEDLKANQATVQTALERMQLLVSLKTNDIVAQLHRIGLLDRLGDGSYGARGTSIEEVICHPKTRIDILNRIDNWVRESPTSDNRVLWIRGMAGRGKSTIASTVANNWGSKGSCAIFHFRRGENALDDRFVCSLARQLAKALVPDVGNAILDCVNENEDIATKRLEQQFKTLFVGSLGKLQDHPHPIVIIVDALDECNNVEHAVWFIQLIGQHAKSFPANVKFLLTSRPEPPLVLALELEKWRMEDLDTVSHVTGDIKLFIQHACARIQERHNLPQPWPSATDLEAIAEMSQGLFQWARTTVAFIGEGSPSHRLRRLLQGQSKSEGLGNLYDQILSRAFEKAEGMAGRKELLSLVLGTLVVAPHSVTLEVIAFLHADHEFLEGEEGTADLIRKEILKDLNSLLYVPKSDSEPVRLMHTSIRDYLVTREREDQRYSVLPVQHHRRLATVSLQAMGRDLKQNICELSPNTRANPEIQDAVTRYVTPGLQYCCHSWSTHLTTGLSPSETKVDATSSELAKFRLLSDEKLLFWLEVMSLIGAMSEAYTMAKQVHQWLLKWSEDTSSDSLKTLWTDAQRFIAAFFKPISANALDIYAVALPQCPVETRLWLKYWSQAMAWILVGKRERNWSANIWTVSAGSEVTSVAFSPSRSSVASGLSNGKVQLWDAETGAALGDPLTGHSDSITSVAFSPDGKVLASGSYDDTVRLWDGQTGAPLGDPLTGHSDEITSVAFSPDGKVLASSSHDRTVRLWNGKTGGPLGDPLTGHSDCIRSVAFSPDGKVLASGSCDRTVRLWDGQTGAPLGDPLTGHREWITSVAFSLDSKVLASGSYDHTVRLWDGQTGASLGDPLTGHSDSITSVAFSRDGKVLASGSYDHTVRLWDGQTGAPLGDPLTGHSDRIMSIAFSPDGKALVSGSNDQTVRLCDRQTGARLGDPLTGHSRSITSAAFSPDGKVLASGSLDDTIRLWDGQTGAPLGDPLTGHSGWITSVAFSPDGKVLASGSYDDTVRLWDGQTGAPLGDPLTGHRRWITPVAFSPDGKVLASGLYDHTIRLWDGQTGAPLGNPLTGHSDSITSVAFSRDGKVLASGSYDDTVRLWDGQTGAPLGDPLTGHSDWITSVAFSPDGKVLASGSHDRTVRLWDGRTGAPLGDPLTGHSDRILSVAFSPDGKVLASGSDDHTVRLWDGWTGAPLGDPLTGHSDWIMSVAFSLDGKVLASVSKDGVIRFWDPLTQRSSKAFCPFDRLTRWHSTG